MKAYSKAILLSFFFSQKEYIFNLILINFQYLCMLQLDITSAATDSNVRAMAEQPIKQPCEITQYSQDACGLLMNFFQRKGIVVSILPYLQISIKTHIGMYLLCHSHLCILRTGVGVPLYSVATIGSEAYAELKLPNGTTIVGKPAPTKQMVRLSFYWFFSKICFN